MTVTQIPEHTEILKRFARLNQNQRLAHAYLLIGPQGIGKGETALAIAKLVNCEGNIDGRQETYCDQCPACLKINSGNHPDVLVIESGNEDSIKIAQVRELINRSQLRPYESRKKVFIIKKIEELTLEGSNALLKTLEEPPQDSLLLLTTSVLEKNLATIRSRCHAVFFFAYPYEQLKKILQETHLDEDTAHFLAFFAEGFPGRARNLNQDDMFRRKNDIINQLILRKNDAAFLKALSADKKQVKQVLDVLLSWFRDLLLLKVHVTEDYLVNVDRRAEMESVTRRFTFGQLKEIIAEIVRANKLLDENLNIKIGLNLLMEKIWVRL